MKKININSNQPTLLIIRAGIVGITIANYCLLNNFELITQETELIGFNKALNLEDIFFSNRKEEDRDSIVFSEKLLFLENH